MSTRVRRLVVGDWVEVRNAEEIVRTLDSAGQLDGMPFMPEMFAFCGKSFQVYKRAHKTCDTVFPVRSRRVDRAVHLNTRCDGGAHGGCQAACLIFWKEAWLKPLGRDPENGRAAAAWETISRSAGEGSAAGCTWSDVWSGVQAAGAPGAEPVYSCQATRLPYATTDLAWWDVRQYAEDYLSGNVSLWRILCGATYWVFYKVSQAGIGLGAPLRWFYDRFHWLWRGAPFPLRTGSIPEGQPTPVVALDLQPGELVRVKSYEAILETLSAGKKNRGMFWDAEMVPYCGRSYRVLKIVTQIIDEKTGRMQRMKTPCVILDSVVCEARYSACRMFCPRSIYPYWREAWLERVLPPIAGAEGAGASGNQSRLAESQR